MIIHTWVPFSASAAGEGMGLCFWRPETRAEGNEAEWGEIIPCWGERMHFQGEAGAKQ